MQTHAYILAVFLFTGCASEPAVGEVSMALTATGGDGATYRLPSQTTLRVENNRFSDALPIDTDASTLTFDVPVGTYNVAVVHPHVSTTMWPLARTLSDGTQDTVWATLATAMPMSLQVTPNTQTALVLAFRVPGSGTIVFAQGSIVVSTEVENVSVTSASAQIGGILTLDGAATADAPAGLADVFPANGVSLDANISGEVAGAWEQVSTTTACAPLTLSGIGSGDAGFVSFMVETTGGSADICVYTRDARHFARIGSGRIGAPTTPTFEGLGATTISAIVELEVELPEPIFTAGVLDLGSLDGMKAGLPLGGRVRLGDRTSGSTVPWYAAQLSGTADLSFQPHE